MKIKIQKLCLIQINISVIRYKKIYISMCSYIFLLFIFKVYNEQPFINNCLANFDLKSTAYFASNYIFIQHIQDAIYIQIVIITVVTTRGRFVPKDNATVEVCPLTLKIAKHVPCIGRNQFKEQYINLIVQINLIKIITH